VGIAAGLVVFVGLGGPLSGRLANLFSGLPPRLQALTLDLNGDRITLSAGQSLVVRPLDQIRLTGFQTNLLGGRGLTVEGKGFDALPLLTGARISDLLPLSSEPLAHEMTVRKGAQILGQVFLVPVSLPVDLVLMSSTAGPTERLSLLKQAAKVSPGNPLLLDQIYRTALENEEQEQATQALAQRMVQVTSPADMAALAELYDKLGRAEERAKLLALLARLEPEKDIWAAQLLSLADKAQDQALKLSALKNLAEGTSGPSSTQAAKKLGYAYVQAGKWPEAAAAYEEAAKLDPADVNIFRNLATIYDRLGDKQKRLGALLSAVRLEPRSVELHKELAELYGQMALPEQRLKQLKIVVQLSPQELEALKVLARESKPQEAAPVWEEVLKLAPQDQEAVVELIKHHQAAGPSQRLVSLYQTLIRLKADDPVVHYNLGLTLMALKRYPEAEAGLLRARELSPKDPDIQTALLEAFQAQGKTPQALETAETLVTLKPGSLELYRLLYREYTKTKELAKLESVLERGVEANPKSVELWKLLSLTRLAGKNLSGAAQALSRAVELDPGDLDNRLRLLKLYEATGQTQAVIREYGALIKLQPKEPEHRMRLAQLLEQKGDLEGAMTQYEEVLKLQPDHEAAGQARLELKMKLLKQGRTKQ